MPLHPNTSTTTFPPVPTHATDDLRIGGIDPLISPAVLSYYLPITSEAANLVHDARTQAEAILGGRDDRLLVVIGPCSIHDPSAALEYGSRLKPLIDRFSEDLQIVMRVYFEKPRTTVGWKGLINDPHLDNSFDINRGLRIARELLLELASLGVPAGTEFLDTISPQYIADLIAWGAMVPLCEEAASRAASDGIECTILDPRTLWPLDIEAIVSSVEHTGRCVIVHEAPKTCGFGSEISALVQERCFLSLEAPITRVTGYDVPFPYTLEHAYLPSVARVLDAVETAVHF